jgi:transcriptional regulator with GAF, ATPase, and Fis domain
VGGTRTLRGDVRVVAATNRELDRLRSEGRFRDDLYFRLNVFPIRVPPLRERREEIAPLLRQFVERYSRKVGKRFASIDRQSILH